MSSRNRASKSSHHNFKRHSDDNTSLSSKQQTSTSGPRSSPSHMQRTESSSSMHHADSTTAQTSSYGISYPSNATSISGSNIYMPNRFAYTEIDLLEVSAWTHPYPHQSPPNYQTSNTSYPSYDSTQTSTCLYHASMMGSDYETARSESGHGFAPLERWLGEHAGDGGALALQLGLQLRADCTCSETQDGVVTNALIDI